MHMARYCAPTGMAPWRVDTSEIVGTSPWSRSRRRNPVKPRTLLRSEAQSHDPARDAGIRENAEDAARIPNERWRLNCLLRVFVQQGNPQSLEGEGGTGEGLRNRKPTCLKPRSRMMPPIFFSEITMNDFEFYDAGSLSVDAYDLIENAVRAYGEDLRFYTHFCSGGGRILELGTGTGRVARSLAVAGHEVCGLDLSSAMLKQAERKRKNMLRDVQARCAFVQGDMADFSLPDTFTRILVPYRNHNDLTT